MAAAAAAAAVPLAPPLATSAATAQPPTDDTAAQPVTVVLQPGAHNLYLGLASDTFAQQLPHVFAEALAPTADPDPAPAAAGLEGPARLAALRFLQAEATVPRDERGRPLETRRAAPPDLSEHNRLVKPQRLPPHNDPDAVDARPMAPDDPPLIFGAEALRLPPAAAGRYRLVWPWRAGRLAARAGRSSQQALDQLAALWHWALQEKLRLPRASRRAARVVLLLPDTCRRRTMKELLQLLLVDLGFGSALLCHESLGVCLAAGLPQACVVSLGHSCTSVACVVEGTVLPETRILLPYGLQEVSGTLHWLMRRSGCFENLPGLAELPPADSGLRRTCWDVLAAQVVRLDYETLRSREVVVNVRLPGEPTLRAVYTLSREVREKGGISEMGSDGALNS